MLVYAVGTDHPYREPCRRIVAAAQSGSIEARTTVEVIQEFVHVRARRCTRDDAASLGRSYLTLLAPLLIVDEAHLGLALTTFEGTLSLGMSDAVLATTALQFGARLVSADAAFSEVVELEHVTPTEQAVTRLLATAW